MRKHTLMMAVALVTIAFAPATAQASHLGEQCWMMSHSSVPCDPDTVEKLTDPLIRVVDQAIESTGDMVNVILHAFCDFHDFVRDVLGWNSWCHRPD